MIEAEVVQPLEAMDASVGVHITENVDETKLTREKFAKGFAWNSSFSLFSKLVFPLAGIYISRKLGPSILGIVAILQMTVAMSDVIREAGLTQLFINEPEMTDELAGAYAALKLLTSIVPALVMIPLGPLFAHFYHHQELSWSVPLVGICLMMNGLGAVPMAQLLRDGDFRRQGMIGMLSASIALTVTVVLVTLHAGFVAPVIQMLLACTLGLVFTLRVKRLPKFNFDWELMRSRAKKSRALVSANVLNNIFLLSDVFVIFGLVGDKASGCYNTAQIIAYKPLDLILFPLSKTLMVAFGREKDPIQLRNIYWRMIRAIILLILPLYVFMACNSSGVILLFFGRDFTPGIPVLTVLCLYLASRTIGSISGNALVPLGKHAWTLYPWILALVVTGGGVWWIHSHPTLMAIVWAFTAGALVVYLSIFFLVTRWMPPSRESGQALAKAFGTLMFTAAFIYALSQAPINPIFGFLAAIPLVAVFHLGLLGVVYGRAPQAYFSKSGLKSFYHSL